MIILNWWSEKKEQGVFLFSFVKEHTRLTWSQYFSCFPFGWQYYSWFTKSVKCFQKIKYDKRSSPAVGFKMVINSLFCD